MHSKYQMKLSVLAKADPINGIWARVCKKCYQLRNGYNNLNGVSRNRTQTFLQIRTKNSNQIMMEVNKIETRLERLSIHLNDTSERITNEIVYWVPDNSSNQCYYCKSNFGFISRKHHCRLCGNLICQNCSLQMKLQTAKETQIKTCKKCTYLLKM
jgi:hypothetical protein